MLGLIGIGLLKSEIKKYLVSVGLISSAGVASATVDNGPCAGRLTASSTLPVTTADTTSATLYFLPYNGNKIPLYNGSTWALHTLGSSGISLDASALTHSQIYDIFIYDSSGTLTLEAVAWSDHAAGTSARATALALQDGVYVKTGATGRRYVGTIRTVNDTGTKVRDAKLFRLIWNAQNRVPATDISTDRTDTWTVSGTNFTWAAINSGNAAWKHAFVVGLDSGVESHALVGMLYTDNVLLMAVALDWSSGGPDLDNSLSNRAGAVGAGNQAATTALYSKIVSAGYHVLSGIETSNGSGTTPTGVGDAGGANQASGITYFGER